MGSRQFWQGCQPWPQAFPKGRSIRPLPSRERGEPQTLKKPYSTLTEASITHSRTGNQFPHVGHATDFSSAIHPPSSHARFLQSVYILPWLEIILAMPNGWEETTIFWVAVEPFFLPTWSQECYVKSILVTGLLFPIHHCQFWLPGCFSSMARTCNCGVCFCCLVWTSWEGKWGLTSLINTVWEGTSHTYLGVFSSSLHTLNTTGREGIAWGTV